MLAMELIRTDPDRVKAALRDKKIDADVDAILALDAERRELLHTVEALRGERNAASKAIAAKSPLMVKWAKECVELVRDHDLLSGIQKEMTRFSEAFTTEDSTEGTQAFLEKRKANFTGK